MFNLNAYKIFRLIFQNLGMHTYQMQKTGALKKRLSFTENIQLLLCEWESRAQIQPVELVFQQLYLSLKVSFSFSSFFGYWGSIWGLGNKYIVPTTACCSVGNILKSSLHVSVMSQCLFFQTI